MLILEILIFVLLFLLFLFLYSRYSYLHSKVEENSNMLNQYFQNIQNPLFSIKERLQDLQEIRTELKTLHLTEHLLQKINEEINALNAIFISRKSGISGEKCLEEILALLPPNLLVKNLKLNDGVVEFALKLKNEKYLPIDSKFIAPELLKNQENSNYLEKEIIKRIRKRAQEITLYLKDEKSVGFAIMTVPDGVYNFLRMRLMEELEKINIILVPYQLLLPVLMFIWFFFEKFTVNYNENMISKYLSFLETSLFELEKNLNQILKEIKAFENFNQKNKEIIYSLKKELEKLKNLKN